ncbi:MAG: KdsC family phosphatase [Bacteriovoracaceae bacterium]
MVRDLRAESKRFSEKLKKIKVTLFDVDGILTDGSVYWDGDDLGFNRSTNTLDGYGLKMLRKAGIKVGVITGGNSIGVLKRFKDNLSLDYVFMGNEDKREAFKAVMKDGYKADEILYMGDEFFDVPLLKKAGFSATVPSASHEIQEVVDYVTERYPGQAPAREVMDLIRYEQGIIPEIPDFEG